MLRAALKDLPKEFHVDFNGMAAELWVTALKNNVIVGSVNANKRHWYKAAEALARADRKWLSRLITRRERPEDFKQALERSPNDIKVVIQFAEETQPKPAGFVPSGTH